MKRLPVQSSPAWSPSARAEQSRRVVAWLHLEAGATLYGSTDLADYRKMKSDYLSLRTQTSTIQLIYADAVNDVTISGQGTIDGRGSAFKKLSWNDEGITRPHLLRFIDSGSPWRRPRRR